MPMAVKIICISPGCRDAMWVKVCWKLSEPNVQKSSATPTVKPASPMRVTMNAFFPASEADCLRK